MSFCNGRLIVTTGAAGNDYDLLFDKFFSPLGLRQAGFFCKDLGDPIISIRSKPTTGQFAGFLVQQPTNAGSAYVTGFEIAYQQRLSYLPGRFGGLGFLHFLLFDWPSRSSSTAWTS